MDSRKALRAGGTEGAENECSIKEEEAAVELADVAGGETEAEAEGAALIVRFRSEGSEEGPGSLFGMAKAT